MRWYIMLGGSFWVALLRNGMGVVLMLSVFLMLDHPRMHIRKAVRWYCIFGVAVTIGFSLWYLFNRDGYIRFAGMLSIPVTGVFCICMSREKLYLSLYKLALGFYLLSVTVFCSVDMSRLWFGESLWADVFIRLFLVAVIIFVIAARIRKSFLEGIDYLREEMDWINMVAVFSSIILAALVAFWPDTHKFSILHIVRTSLFLFMAGFIQYMVFHLYIHRGRENRLQSENRLLEMNERLMYRQMELMRESEREAERIRHDIRHHCLLIEEYIRNNEIDKLQIYVKQYMEDVESKRTERICGNEAINNILAAYVRRAEEEKINVKLNVKVADDIQVRDIDLVAIIANIFENAIHGCISSGDGVREIYMSIILKGKKLVLLCRNTCAADTDGINGTPDKGKRNGIGISSVMKAVSYYNGDAEFSMGDGMFTAKIMMNI